MPRVGLRLASQVKGRLTVDLSNRPAKHSPQFGLVDPSRVVQIDLVMMSVLDESVLRYEFGVEAFDRRRLVGEGAEMEDLH